LAKDLVEISKQVIDGNLKEEKDIEERVLTYKN
jgi:hypothetical protein